jgi:hypothetical protein
MHDVAPEELITKKGSDDGWQACSKSSSCRTRSTMMTNTIN